MEICDSLFNDFATIFYNSENAEEFLLRAEELCSLRFSLKFPKDFCGENASSSFSNCCQCAQNELDIVSKGFYICTLAASGASGIQYSHYLRDIAKFIGKGILLHGWFLEAANVHPNVFLVDCSQAEEALYCLYVPADMGLRYSGILCSKMSENLRAIHLYKEKNGFALILEGKLGKKEQENAITEISDVVSSFKAIAGLSGPFSNRNLAQGCMEKAKEAALMPEAVDISHLRCVSHLRWRMFCENAARSLEADGYCIDDFLQHVLKRVLHYDAENNTHYYESIYRYLIYGKNMKLAAQSLSVHRNTLDYRISRAKELFNIDFDNMRICFELLFSYKLYEGIRGVL